MTQQEKIELAIAELARRENEFAAAHRTFAEAEHDYRMAKASAFLLAEGSVELRKFTADKAVWNEMKAKLAAEATLEIMKQKILDCRQVLSARQSLLSAESRNFQISEKYSA